MWADAWNLAVARRNPRRWSPEVPLARAIESLEPHCETSRPVLVIVSGPETGKSEHRCASVRAAMELLGDRLARAGMDDVREAEPQSRLTQLPPALLLMVLEPESARRLVHVLGLTSFYMRLVALSDALWLPHLRTLNAELAFMPDDQLCEHAEAAVEADPMLSFQLMYQLLYLRATDAAWRLELPATGVLAGTKDAAQYCAGRITTVTGRVPLGATLVAGAASGAFLGFLFTGMTTGSTAAGVTGSVGLAAGAVVESARLTVAGVTVVALAPGTAGRLLGSAAESFRSLPGTALGHWKNEQQAAVSAARRHKWWGAARRGGRGGRRALWAGERAGQSVSGRRTARGCQGARQGRAGGSGPSCGRGAGCGGWCRHRAEQPGGGAGAGPGVRGRSRGGGGGEERDRAEHVPGQSEHYC